jgi:hypothetical protein
MPSFGTPRKSRPFTCAASAVVLALFATSVAGAPPVAAAAAAPAWQAVNVGPFSVQSIDGAPNGLAVGLQEDQTITFRVGGVWTATTVKGEILGVVDKGTAGATAYVVVSENLTNVDLDGDSLKTKYQVRKAVNAPVLQLLAGPPPLVDQSWLENIVVQPKAITSMIGTAATQLKGAGIVVGSTIVPTSTARPTYINGDDWGFGRYLIKADGAIVDSALNGDVVGLVGTTPIVDLASGDRVLAAASPIIIGDSVVDAPPRWSPIVSWGLVSEFNAGDVNDDLDAVDVPLCRIEETGVSECLPDYLELAPSPSIWPVGNDAVVFRATDLNVIGIPSPALYFFRYGAAAYEPIGGNGNIVLTGPKSALVKVEYASGTGPRFKWIRIGLNGPEASSVLDQSFAANSTEGVSLGDNRYLIDQVEEGTDLNGDGDTTDTVAQLITASTKVNLRVIADIDSALDNPPAAALEPGGAFAFAVTEGTDLNGDGDTNDDVVHVYDNGLINLRLATSDKLSNYIPEFAAGEADGELAIIVPETIQGADLNGDGDRLDQVGYIIRHAPTVGALQPARLLDTRSGIGYTGSKPTPGQTIDLQVSGRGGVPASGANAVVLNITMTEASDAGFVTVWGDGTQPGTSNLNITGEGSTIPNLVLAPIGVDGKVRIFTSGGGHLIADAVTWFGAAGPYSPVTPDRLLDTRSGGTVGYTGAKPAANAIVDVQVTGRAGITATPGQLVVLNVTAVDATDAGYLSVWGPGGQPLTSNVNIASPGLTVPNLVVIPVGADGKVHIFTNAGAHLLADVFGTLSGPTVTATAPDRLLDTRPGPAQRGYSGPKPGAGATVTLAIGNPGEIKIINVTATNVTAPGFVTVWPEGLRPTTSNLNPEFRGQSVANLVFAPVGSDGKIRLYTSDGTDLVGDVFGTISI